MTTHTALTLISNTPNTMNTTDYYNDLALSPDTDDVYGILTLDMEYMWDFADDLYTRVMGDLDVDRWAISVTDGVVRVGPVVGPTVTLEWGDLLRLQYFVRNHGGEHNAETMRLVMRAERQARVRHAERICREVSESFGDVTLKCYEASNRLVKRLEAEGVRSVRVSGLWRGAVHNWVEVMPEMYSGSFWLDPTSAQFGVPNGLVRDRSAYTPLPEDWRGLVSQYPSSMQVDKIHSYKEWIEAGAEAKRVVGDHLREVRTTKTGNPYYYQSWPATLYPNRSDLRSVAIWESSPGVQTVAVCRQYRFLRDGRDIVPCKREWWVNRHGVLLKREGDAFVREEEILIRDALAFAGEALGIKVLDCTDKPVPGWDDEDFWGPEDEEPVSFEPTDDLPF